MWGYGHMLGGGWGFGIGLIFEIVFWGLIIWLIVSLARGGGRGCCGMGIGPGHGHGKSDEDVQEILKKRYAKGEITKEQFESMKKDLQ